MTPSLSHNARCNASMVSSSSSVSTSSAPPPPPLNSSCLSYEENGNDNDDRGSEEKRQSQPMSPTAPTSQKVPVAPSTESPRGVTQWIEDIDDNEIRHDHSVSPLSRKTTTYCLSCLTSSSSSCRAPLLMLNFFESSIKVVDYPKLPDSSVASSGRKTLSCRSRFLQRRPQQERRPCLYPMPSLDSEESTTIPPTAASTVSSSCSDKASAWDLRGIQWGRKGRWQEALSCWLDALRLRTSSMTSVDANVARTANNVAIALSRLKRYQDALDLWQQALRIEKDLLAGAQQDQEQHHLCAGCYCTLSTSSTLLDEQRQDYARILYNWGVTCQIMGRAEMAIPYLYKVSKVLSLPERRHIVASSLSYDSSSAKFQAATLYQLGLAHQASGLYIDAWECLEESRQWLFLLSDDFPQEKETRKRQGLVQQELVRVEDVLAKNLQLSFQFE